MSKNRITSQGTYILEQINSNVKEINLSVNRIGLSGCGNIGKILYSDEYHLQNLNVSDNCLLDAGVNIILDNLKLNSSLLILNFSNNKCTDNVNNLMAYL